MNDTIKKEISRGCLFCKKGQDKVKMLMVPAKDDILGICDGCVKICLDMMYKKRAEEIKKSVSLETKHDTEVIDDVTNTGIPKEDQGPVP